MLALGTPAPAFRLPDYDGRLHALEDFAAQPALLVAFICSHCPFVRHLRKEFAAFAREYAPRGLAIVAINSNDIEAYPQDGPEAMREEAAALGYGFPYLLDESQDVAPRTPQAERGARLRWRQVPTRRWGNSRAIWCAISTTMRMPASRDVTRDSDVTSPRQMMRPEAGSSTNTTTVPSRTVVSRGRSEAGGSGMPLAVRTLFADGAPTRGSSDNTNRRVPLTWTLTSMSAPAGSVTSTNPLRCSSLTTAWRTRGSTTAASSGSIAAGVLNAPPFQAKFALPGRSASGAAKLSTVRGVAQPAASAATPTTSQC